LRVNSLIRSLEEQSIGRTLVNWEFSTLFDRIFFKFECKVL
ncbi:MAG: hypothetical protein ACI86M_003418, partial [Saprospiraceae bacterium]